MGEPRTCPQCGAVIPADAPEGGCPNCMLAAGLGTGGAPSAPGVPSVEEVERRIPGFEILAVVGHGGMGVVYKARQKALDRVVALKVLPPATAASPGFAERFVREAKALARLTHPHIVAVHDFGQADGGADGPLFWLVMEYVDGMNVREAMRAGRVGPKEALAIVPQICDALQYAHDRGVVHRDVKPENVLIDRDGRVKVADFGLAKLASRESGDASLTGAQQVMGTVHYMAPEQWQRPKEVDHRADIYSLGVVFYEMLTGDLPLGRFEPPSAKAQIDVRVDEVVLRSLERERERRWQHVSEMKSKVDEIASAPRAAAPPVPAAAPPVAAGTRDEGREEAEKAWPDTFANAAITGVVALAFGIWAYVSVPGMWWVAGTFGVGAAAQAITAASKRAKEARSATPAAPPAPRGPWLTSRMTALVAAAFIALVATMAWGINFATHQRGNAVGSLAVVLGFALLVALAVRWASARNLDAAARQALGTPVLLSVFSVASLVLGATCLIPSGGGGTGASLPPVVIMGAPPQAPTPAPTRAPWEFEIEVPKGVTAQPDKATRNDIWRKWSTVQGLHGSGAIDQMSSLYAESDWEHIAGLSDAEKKAACAKGLLGLPGADDSAIGAPLDKFHIQKVVFGGYDDKARFETALLVASDGRHTLRAAMVFGEPEDSTREQWLFVVAPVEVE